MSRTIDAHHHFWRTAAQEQPWRTDAHEAFMIRRQYLHSFAAAACIGPFLSYVLADLPGVLEHSFKMMRRVNATEAP